MRHLFLLLLFVTFTCRLSSQISIIGPATPSNNWTTDHDLTLSSGVWTGTFALNAGELKFRNNHDWAENWGASAFPSGTAVANGPSIPVSPAGVYIISFDLTTLAYTFTLSIGNVGIATATPTQKLEVNGKIKLGDDPNPPSAGTVRWNDAAQDFEGYDGSQWRSLTKANTPAWGPDDISLHENDKLTASDGAWTDWFGHSVAISGDYAIVGAYWDDIGSNYEQGSAYIFQRSGTSWYEYYKLTANDGAEFAQFGISVSISGDYAIVGAAYDDIGSNTNQGSAYIFHRSGTSWTQQIKLTASDGATGDNFGASVSISGDYAIVGAVNDDIGSNTNQGSAYIFAYDSGVSTWVYTNKLTASDGATNDYFGASVSISGDYAIVGAYGDDIGSNTNQGSAYIFHRSGTSWTQQAQLTASDGESGDYFGHSVSISGDYAITGAYYDNIGSNTDQGSAYIFYKSGTSWTQQIKLTASDGVTGEWFGFSVSISGDYAIVGALNDAIGNNGSQGSAYIFHRSGTTWTQQAKLTASDGESSESFGNSVSISGDEVIIGAEADDIVSENEGSAYIFHKN